MSGCKEKLTTVNTYRCKDCSATVCLKHRFPADHGCEERKAAVRAASRSSWTFGFQTQQQQRQKPPAAASAARPAAQPRKPAPKPRPVQAPQPVGNTIRVRSRSLPPSRPLPSLSSRPLPFPSLPFPSHPVPFPSPPVSSPPLPSRPLPSHIRSNVASQLSSACPIPPSVTFRSALLHSFRLPAPIVRDYPAATPELPAFFPHQGTANQRRVGELPECCQACGARFATVEKLIRHAEEYHQQASTGPPFRPLSMDRDIHDLTHYLVRPFLSTQAMLPAASAASAVHTSSKDSHVCSLSAS